MRTWWKFLVALSLFGNIYLMWNIYERDRYVNWITWGNTVNFLWWAIDEERVDPIRPDPEGFAPPRGAERALEIIETVRTLPYYNQRVEYDEMRTLELFLRYSRRANEVAAAELKENGRMSDESVERLTKLNAGLERIVSYQSRTNELAQRESRNPWNHAEWRAIWQDIVNDLRSMEFVPLPE